MKIDKVETWSERIPLTRPYTIAYERVDVVELHFVRLHAGAHVGLGSASPLPEVTGESAAECREAMRTRDVLELLADTRGRTPAARAAFDMALYDLKAKNAGKPLVEFLGREHDSLVTSITIGIKDSAADVLAEADEYVGRGFRCLKIKIGRALEEDLERVRRLRERFGASIRLRIDANQGYRAAELGRLFSAAEELGVEFVEQPLAPALDGELAQLSTDARRKLALDESLLGLQDAERLARPEPVCGIFNIKLMKCGGVAPALAIARVAERAGIALMWGCSDESRLGIAAALHAAFATRATKYLDLDGHLDLARDPARGGFTLEEGMMRLSGEPGLGVDLERNT